MNNANVSYKTENDALILKLDGIIDSANAKDVETAVFSALSEAPAKHVVIDCEDLRYISSTGLRVVLRLKKAVRNIDAVNVSPAVYDIFQVTGFTELLNVRKAYRTISVDGCEVIGRGANGRVCRIDRDTIVKVYNPTETLDDIQRETAMARKAFILGIPTAIPFDVVRIEGGGYGSVFELLDAKSFADLLASGEKTVGEIAEMSVSLLKTIHGTEVEAESMPDMKAVALGWAEPLGEFLPEYLHKKLIGLIAAIPHSDHMLHGDFHIKNIMYQDGESLLIDMDSLCAGHPVFEFAGMFNAYIAHPELDPASAEAFLGIPCKMAEELWKKSLSLYFDGASADELRTIEKKIMIAGYTHLMRSVTRRGLHLTEKGAKAVENFRGHLAELLPEVDDLAF
ncbi:MAG: anti-sigma factor antagonist [Firmicutes bacterium]|nr:anti-sigma factor antagonist [Bacillota bacterium]